MPGGGTRPTAKERIGTKEERRAPERQRRKDRKPGGQPGHLEKGLKRDPGRGRREAADPLAGRRACRGPLDGAALAGEPWWAQVIDVEAVRTVTEILLSAYAARAVGLSRSPDSGSKVRPVARIYHL